MISIYQINREIDELRGYWKAKGFTAVKQPSGVYVLKRRDCLIQYARNAWKVQAVDGLTTIKGAGKSAMLLTALKLAH
jgi:hypothetical protein